MTDSSLQNCRILVVEDEYMLADEMRLELGRAGAIVLGPVGTVEEAIERIKREPDLDGAVLDVNLGGEMVYPAADVLVERGVPFVFATGYDASVIPARFEHIARCEKPVDIARITRAIGRACLSAR